ncbi:hypothetical protein PR002_g3991 [Phytophthora rubi]|uniref:Integrase catalytic domain-containing protein n=1 Tax=Phytophthora rubi TaxID=129364 RepID=A0A6A3NG35_9STRA|nr:hypothetical protein PR002_g3991 [Phytophthora rubi]
MESRTCSAGMSGSGTCARKMADEGLVEGMMLRRRQFDICEACQLGKQRAKPAHKHLDRGITEKNELVFADLFFPPKNYNCTRFKAALVIMDAHTRFLTAYPVKDKTKQECNLLIQRYIAWAERQCPGYKVRGVFTDGGGEFVNTEMEAWCQRNDIVHTTTPRDTSRLNRVERSHQTLCGMMKSMLKESMLPTSFGVDALYYAVYLKNRSYSDTLRMKRCGAGSQTSTTCASSARWPTCTRKWTPRDTNLQTTVG